MLSHHSMLVVSAPSPTSLIGTLAIIDIPQDIAKIHLHCGKHNQESPFAFYFLEETQLLAVK